MTGPPSTEHHEQPLLSTDMVVNSEHQKVNGQMRTDVEEAELVMVETQNSETTTDTVCQSSSLQPSSTSSPILNRCVIVLSVSSGEPWFTILLFMEIIGVILFIFSLVDLMLCFS